MLYDDLIAIGMLVLRLAVPVILTVVIGYWLEKRLGLERLEPIVLEEHAAKPFRMAGGAAQIGTWVRCWQVEHCDLPAPAECAAYVRPAIPYWLAKELAYGPLEPECPGRELYKLQATSGAAHSSG